MTECQPREKLTSAEWLACIRVDIEVFLVMISGAGQLLTEEEWWQEFHEWRALMEQECSKQ
jgi:hypothetical protein